MREDVEELKRELETLAKHERWKLPLKTKEGLKMKGTCYTTFAYNF